MAFQEIDFSEVRFSEALPLAKQCHDWIVETFKRFGRDPQIGLHLFRIFVEAGLPEPAMILEAKVGGGNTFRGISMAKFFVEFLLPEMEGLNVTTASEIAIITLEERLRAESAAAKSVMVLPALIGAWTRSSIAPAVPTYAFSSASAATQLYAESTNVKGPDSVP